MMNIPNLAKMCYTAEDKKKARSRAPARINLPATPPHIVMASIVMAYVVMAACDDALACSAAPHSYGLCSYGRLR